MNALQKINDLEKLINIELSKAKLLLELLNCENLDKIKELLLKIFKEIEKLESEDEYLCIIGKSSSPSSL